MKDITTNVLEQAETYRKYSSCDSWDRTQFYTDRIRNIFGEALGAEEIKKIHLYISEGGKTFQRSYCTVWEACDEARYYGKNFRLAISGFSTERACYIRICLVKACKMKKASSDKTEKDRKAS